MNLRRLRAWTLVPLLTLVMSAGACAESSESAGPEEDPRPDAGGDVVDGGAADAAADRDAAAEGGPLCSPQGWCATTLPQPAPSFEELWALPGAAFAVDRSNGIFAFDGSPTENRWSVIYEGAGALNAVWAPHGEEVWAGGDRGRIVHGIRSGGSWTWSTEVVAGPDAGPEDVVAIWGAGAADVFALSTHHLYRWRPASGAGWKVELEKSGDTVPPECGDGPSAAALGTFAFRRIVATSADDMWLVGRKNALSPPIFPNTFCDYLVHKTGALYETVSDCRIEHHEDEGSCDFGPKAPLLHTWIDDLFTVAPGRVVTHWRGPFSAGPGRWNRIERTPAGAHESSSAETSVYGPSAWGASEDKVYVGAPGRVYVNEQLWDGGDFAVSSVALNGVPLTATFKIRGRSADDVWAIGGSYALHKTQP